MPMPKIDKNNLFNDKPKAKKASKAPVEVNQYFAIAYKAVNGWDIKLFGSSYPASAKLVWEALVEAGDYSELNFSVAEWPADRKLKTTDFEVVRTHRGAEK